MLDRRGCHESLLRLRSHLASSHRLMSRNGGTRVIRWADQRPLAKATAVTWGEPKGL